MPGIRMSSTIASGWPFASSARERLGAVGRQLDLVALELERAPERVAHGALVVHDQDLHDANCAESG